ncbi:MAG: type 1 glutamine amidotransferase [Agromyces sp.]
MRALILTHFFYSHPGPVAERLLAHGFELDEQLVVPREQIPSPNVHFDFPSPHDYDVLVVLGSHWGVWQDDVIGNWLLPELEWMREAVQSDVPVLGICFGGQLMARALGGSVAPGPRGEFGWTTVMTDDESVVSSGPWFEYHNDRWTLPAGVREVARSPLASQAFTVQRSLAVQFHPEVDAAVLAEWFAQGTGELESHGFNPAVMTAHTEQINADARARTFALVDGFLERAGLLSADRDRAEF